MVRKIRPLLVLGWDRCMECSQVNKGCGNYGAIYVTFCLTYLKTYIYKIYCYSIVLLIEKCLNCFKKNCNIIIISKACDILHISLFKIQSKPLRIFWKLFLISPSNISIQEPWHVVLNHYQCFRNRYKSKRASIII